MGEFVRADVFSLCERISHSHVLHVQPSQASCICFSLRPVFLKHFVYLCINTLRMGSFKLFKRPFPGFFNNFNPLNAELNPICYLLALLARHFLHVSSIRVNRLLYCVSLKIYNKFANYFYELKFSGNTHQRP